MHVLCCFVIIYMCTHRCSVVAQLPEDTPTDWNRVIAAVVSVSDGRLWLGTDSGLYVIQRTKQTLTLHNMTSVEGGITTLAWRSSFTIKERHDNQMRAFTMEPQLPYQYLAHTCTSSGGLLGAESMEPRESAGGRGTFGVLVVGTQERVYFYNGEMWWHEWVSGWYRGQGGAVDGVPSALTFTLTGELFIANNVSLTQVNINYTFNRHGPLQGLPYNQIQALHHSTYTSQHPPALMYSQTSDTACGEGSDGTLWVGTLKGFALYDISSGQFQHYFYGRRWHPGEAVLGFASNGGNGTVVWTDGGIAVIYPQLWTLEEKAHHYQAMLARHTRHPGTAYTTVYQLWAPVADYSD